jgi:hypothetical protein
MNNELDLSNYKFIINMSKYVKKDINVWINNNKILNINYNNYQ